jgi:subtilisin family serine protease
MTLRSTAIFALASAALVSTAGLPAQSAESGLRAISPKFQRTDEIEAALKQESSTRVIVTLKAPDAGLAGMLEVPASRTQAKATIKATIDSAVMRHFGPAAKVNGAGVVRMTTAPQFSAVLTRDQLLTLAADGAVASIIPDAKATTQLDVTTVTIGMPAAWTAGATGNNMTSAVIDTGVQTDHPFIGNARVVAEGCFLTTNSCPNSTNEMTGVGAGFPTSGIAHGTHVSGIVLGKNTVAGASPASGVAKQAKLIAINVFESTGYTYDSSMIRALEFVEDMAIANPAWNIRSVNMSIGGGSYTEYCDSNNSGFRDVLNRLRTRKISTVVAAGNEYQSSAMSSPGCYSSVYSVAATNRLGDTIAYYSNISSVTRLFGPGGDVYNGGGVVSSVLGSLYEAYQGTSMATPHVAGAIAALATKFPGTDISVIEDALRRTGVSVTDTRVTGGFTLPRMRVDAAATFLQAPTIPPQDAWSKAKSITAANRVYMGSTTGATRESGEPTNGSSSAGSIWYKIKLPTTQKLTLSTFGSNFDTVLSVYTGSAVNALTLKNQNDNGGAAGELWSRVTFLAQANVTYSVAIVAKSASKPGIVRFSVIGLPANDDFAAARTVSVSSTALTLASGTNVNATIQTGEPLASRAASVWWKFTAPVAGSFTIDTIGSALPNGGSFDTVLGVYTGSAVNALTQVAFNDDAVGSASRVTFTATQGTTYYVAVAGYSSAHQGNIRMTFTPPGFVYQNVGKQAAK